MSDRKSLIKEKKQAYLKRQADKVTNVVTNKNTAKLMVEIAKWNPEGARIPVHIRNHMISSLLTKKALKDKGVPVDKDTRISLREFEEFPEQFNKINLLPERFSFVNGADYGPGSGSHLDSPPLPQSDMTANDWIDVVNTVLPDQVCTEVGPISGGWNVPNIPHYTPGGGGGSSGPKEHGEPYVWSTQDENWGTDIHAM